MGELGGGFKGGDANLNGVPINEWYAGILTHRSSVGIRARELAILSEYISDHSSDPAVNMVAVGTIGADVLHALALGVSFSSVTLINHLISYQSILQTEKYQPKFILSAVAGSNQLYDLPELSHFAPTNLHIINPIDASGLSVDKGALKDYGVFRSSTLGLDLDLSEEQIIERVLRRLE